jgi:rubredoxin
MAADYPQYKKIRCPQCNIPNMLFLVPYRPFEMGCPKCNIGKINVVRIDVS